MTLLTDGGRGGVGVNDIRLNICRIGTTYEGDLLQYRERLATSRPSHVIRKSIGMKSRYTRIVTEQSWNFWLIVGGVRVGLNGIRLNICRIGATHESDKRLHRWKHAKSRPSRVIRKSIGFRTKLQCPNQNTTTMTNLWSTPLTCDTVIFNDKLFFPSEIACDTLGKTSPISCSESVSRPIMSY